MVDDGSGQPIANAEVLDLATNARSRSDERGEVRIAGRLGSERTLRIRQVGFSYVDQVLNDATPGSVIVRLRRVAYALSTVHATAHRACDDPPDAQSSELSATLLRQLRLTAEQYESFRRDFPFRVEIGRRTARMQEGRFPNRIDETTGRIHSSSWREPYRPGRVLIHGNMGFSVPILFLSTLADSTFWAHHCFAFAGVDERGAERWLQLDFTPASDLRSPDWAGTAYIDSATSALRRLEFRLVGLDENSVPRRLEGFTTFRSPSPYMVVPDTTMAVWWRRKSSPEWGDPQVGQMLYIRSLTWLRGKPPAQD